MDTLILVLASLAAATALVMIIAIRRGWLRLGSVPTEDRVMFVLMSKKNTNPSDVEAAAKIPDSQQVVRSTLVGETTREKNDLEPRP